MGLKQDLPLLNALIAFEAAATSAGQALAMTGAILGHRNPRSTAIYAHVQLAPAKRAAERASSKIAVALGRPLAGRRRPSTERLST